MPRHTPLPTHVSVRAEVLALLLAAARQHARREVFAVLAPPDREATDDVLELPDVVERIARHPDLERLLGALDAARYLLQAHRAAGGRVPTETGA